MRFEKFEGLGNDFILVEDSLDKERAEALCDRHRGIGADGVLVIDRNARSMRVLNADGSTPEMCGNGLRCVALYLVKHGVFAERQSFSVETDAGPHGCAVDRDQVSVWMRHASLDPRDLPVASAQPVIDEAWTFGGETLRITGVSMGNPHAVTFDDVGVGARARLGPVVEVDARFPERTNVGFARLDGQRIVLDVWERGVGFTQACGTGACAAAYAAVVTERCERHRPTEIELPGGILTITVGDDGAPIQMEGPARHVFDGTV
ncbi:MAG: diaminopimelate epimerase [Myxococcota bacterium]